MRRRQLLFLAVFLFPWLLQAATVRLINNSPYDLRAVVRGSDGTYLSEIVIKARKETVWTDVAGQFGVYGGATGSINESYRSMTPYTVLWYCMDGEDYAVCDVVATGSLVLAQGCTGSRMCKPQKKERYPNQPQGQYLYQPPTNPPLSQ